MSKTATSVIINALEGASLSTESRTLANHILDDLSQAGFTITPTIIESAKIGADLKRPVETIPWFANCHLCMAFCKEAEDHAGLFTWVSAMAKHFDKHHDIDLVQDAEAVEREYPAWVEG